MKKEKYDAKVMSKGQVTIPKAVRDHLGLENGDRVAFLIGEEGVRMIKMDTYILDEYLNKLRYMPIKEI